LYKGFLWENLRERDHWRNPGVDGRITLRWIFRSGMWGYGLDLAGSGKRQVKDTCDCVNEPSGPIKCCEFFD